MTNFIELLETTARRLKATIEAIPGLEAVPTDDYGWENHRWRHDLFRLAHLELFNQDRFMVVHLCVFPHADDPAPIFGFDVIAGENKVTGVFLDLSPTIKDPGKFHNLSFKHQRARPEWGDIFSQNWIACRPDESEMMMIADEADSLLKHYLNDIIGKEKGDINSIRLGQNRYCNQQRQNEHTFKALKNLIGIERARTFMDEILFPTL